MVLEVQDLLAEVVAVAVLVATEILLIMRLLVVVIRGAKIL